jgi:glutaredoxin
LEEILPARRPKVELYSKPQCPLCEEARDVLSDVRVQVDFELVEHNILTDPVAYSRYRYDIPVVFIDGEKVFSHRVDEQQLKEQLLSRGGTEVADLGSREG